MISCFLECLVRISTNNRGQIEIDLTKQIEQMWKTIGKFSLNHLSVRSMVDFGMFFSYVFNRHRRRLCI